MSAIINARNSYALSLKKEQTTFIEGAASAIDIGGDLMKKYQTYQTESEADMTSLRKDWEAIGQDIRTALDSYDKQNAR
jgi:hypothetical protein